MTAFAIVTGVLFKTPEQRTSKTGKPFVTAIIRVRDGEAPVWWKIVAFAEDVRTELARLDEGELLLRARRFQGRIVQTRKRRGAGFPLDSC